MFSKDGYVLVSWEKLLRLLHHDCLTPDCHALVVPEETKIAHQGATVSLHLCCTENHVNIWHSSDFYERKTAAGRVRSKLNVRLASYLLTTGLQFSPMEVVINILALMMGAKSILLSLSK